LLLSNCFLILIFEFKSEEPEILSLVEESDESISVSKLSLLLTSVESPETDAGSSLSGI